jgi:hydroxypyruvate isomerase
MCQRVHIVAAKSLGEPLRLVQLCRAPTTGVLAQHLISLYKNIMEVCMINFSANLSMLFTDHPFLDRLSLARQAGFRAVEFWFPYAFEVSEVVRAVHDAQLSVVLFNLPAGNWEQGERGIAVLPDRQQEFRDGVHQALQYAESLNVPCLNCLVGRRPASVPRSEAWHTLVENLQYAADRLCASGRILLIEAVNPFDVPQFFLTTPQDVATLLDDVRRPNVRMLADLYHWQRTQGEICATLSTFNALIGHIQIADNPGRHQPGTGELHYGRILRYIDRLGYAGYVGLEYQPLGSTEESLSWWRAYQTGTFLG